jgi:hypothetical protein
VNRDSLFSFHRGAERFLAQLVAIYTAAHYKNQPDDLQLVKLKNLKKSEINNGLIKNLTFYYH